MPIYNQIINQKGTPAFYSDIFANRPAFGYAGRVFISTDTGAIYEDTGTAWTLIADAGAGTTGTLQQVTTNGNTTTLPILVQTLRIGLGNSSVATNTILGVASLTNNTTGNNNTAVGNQTLPINTTGFSNTAIGSYSLAANTTGNYNTALGMQSLYNNSTGAHNTGLGQGALALNTTASFNTAVGSASLSANTTGTNNTAVGYVSLNGNTTGANNVAIGYGALTLNTTASNNTAIGNTSLEQNTTGVNNTAIGSSSLKANTTGQNNTAIGTSSLIANTTGAQNTAIGSSALNLNTTANNNTAIGYASLQSNTTGADNTALGTSVLVSNTTGQRNTGIGSSALSGITTGSNNTTIGYSCGNAITTGSNNTIIGNYAGTSTLASNIVLSDGAGNVRLFSDANGLIGIGQAVGTPGGQLDIHTTQTYALVLNGNTTNNAYEAFSSDGVGKWRIGNTYNAGANSFNIHNLTTTSNAISILSTNNYVGISTDTPSSKLHIVDTTATTGTVNSLFIQGATKQLLFGFISDGTNITNARIRSGGSTPLSLGTTSSNDAVYIFNNGNVALGSTIDDTINKLQVTGSATFSSTVSMVGLTNTSTSTFSSLATFNGNVSLGGNSTYFSSGAVTLGGAATLSNLAGTGSRAVLADANGLLSAPVSDILVKQNIQTIGYGLSEILKMKPVWFNYNDEYKNYGEGRQNGNIAQEMENIIPEAVFTTPSTGKMGINYDQLHAVYIKAIQELKAEIDALKNN